MIEEKILEILKEGEKSSSEISVKIGRNFYVTTDLLEKLLEEKKIEKLEIGKHILWGIKNAKKR